MPPRSGRADAEDEGDREGEQRLPLGREDHQRDEEADCEEAREQTIPFPHEAQPRRASGRRAATVSELLGRDPGGPRGVDLSSHAPVPPAAPLPVPANRPTISPTGSPATLGLDDVGRAAGQCGYGPVPNHRPSRQSTIEILEEVLAAKTAWPRLPGGRGIPFHVLPHLHPSDFLMWRGTRASSWRSSRRSASTPSIIMSSNPACGWRGGRTISPSGSRRAGTRDLAAALSRLDPYTITLEGLRREIIRLVE